MAASIKFDSTEILNTTYVPRYVKHETAAERLLNSMELAREDGEILISEKYGKKIITLIGVIVGTSQADVESKIDTFKELFSRVEKNLDVDWNGSTRRYVATCRDHRFDRDHYNIKFVPWAAEFVVLSGEGKDTSETTVLNEHALATTTPATDSFAMAGSKPAKPYIKIQGNNFPATAKGIEYKNTDNGEKIIITRDYVWPNTGIIEIDCDAKTVTENLSGSEEEGKFYGVFPKFIVGTNNIQLTVGGIVNQKSYLDGWSGASGITITTGNTRIAQSFSVPYADATFKGIILGLSKAGNPGNMTVRIETDNGDQPSGVLADANATFTITNAEVTGGPTLITKYSANTWALEANTKYWIVISGAAPIGGPDYFSVWYANQEGYTRGNYSISLDAGVTYTGNTAIDLAFAILYGGEPGASNVKHTVKYTKKYL